VNKLNERAYLVKNNVGKWLEIVASLTEPSQQHKSKIWIECTPAECISWFVSQDLEYLDITDTIH
jgi:hypothetical protein